MPRKLTPQKNFERKLKQLIKESDSLSKTAIKRTQGLLNQTRKNILGELAGAPADSWQAHRLGELKRAVEGQLNTFKGELQGKIAKDQAAGWSMGKQLVDGPIQAAGIRASLTELSTTTLSVLQGYSADLVTGLSQDAFRKVNTQITQGILGEKTPFEIMQNISKDVFGVDKGIAARAETITRTEIARVQNAATQARQEQTVKAGVPLKKRWTGCSSRPEHLAVEGQIRDVDEPFDVGGEQLMYPGDPAGSPGNIINCGGYSAPHIESWSNLPGL